ncbi:anti-sigma-D factor RsdA [Pseudonocardia sp.]|uniref:anti-sigma-D factor RsdA n=1 Tax=Pseudonocardia sp. TaxID=60912 RepID=UPI00260D2C80|nr:anti-sigma-D factor RsdA [Pseudonocardia sp.]
MQDERRGFGETSPRRPRTNGSHSHRRNGNQPEFGRARPVPFSEVADEPVDLVAVQADDELISALAAGMSVSAPGVGGYDADDQVAALLAAWRAEVDAEPLPEMIDLDTATATVLAASRPPARRNRHLATVAAAAAVIVFSIGGVSIGASDARPGDALWDVSRVLYAERAESVEAAERIEIRIDEAKAALERGEPAQAAQALAAAEDDLIAVRVEEGRAELAEVQSFLEAKAAETPQGQRNEPGAPLASDPARPVPPRASTDTPASESATSPSDTTTVAPSPSDPAVSPLDASVSPTTGVDPSVSPSAEDEPSTGSGEGSPDDTTGSTSSTTGTAEGSPDATTSGGGQSMGTPESTAEGSPTPAS